MVKGGFSFLKETKNAPSDYLRKSNEAQLRKKAMFQIPEELLHGAKSGHMLWALRDQVEEEGAAHRLAEVEGGESEEKQPPPIHALRRCHPNCRSRQRTFCKTRPAWHLLQQGNSL